MFDSSLCRPVILLLPASIHMEGIRPDDNGLCWVTRSSFCLWKKQEERNSTVKVMLNVPFRNSSSALVRHSPLKRTRQRADENAVRGNASKLCARSNGSLTTSELSTTFCLQNMTATGTTLTHSLRPFETSIYHLEMYLKEPKKCDYFALLCRSFAWFITLQHSRKEGPQAYNYHLVGEMKSRNGLT